MKLLREVLGYLLGGVLFVVLMPVVMWLASGRPEVECVAASMRSGASGHGFALFLGGLLMIGGLALSVWTIVYMKRKGKGNPMDAFGHEVAPRTRYLMTGGPYRINRNPMLSGTLLYLAGVGVWLWCWQAWVVWAVFLAVMFIQVLGEERRLHRDFGDEYDLYCRRTRRF